MNVPDIEQAFSATTVLDGVSYTAHEALSAVVSEAASLDFDCDEFPVGDCNPRGTAALLVGLGALLNGTGKVVPDDAGYPAIVGRDPREDDEVEEAEGILRAAMADIDDAKRLLEEGASVHVSLDSVVRAMERARPVVASKDREAHERIYAVLKSAENASEHTRLEALRDAATLASAFMRGMAREEPGKTGPTHGPDDLVPPCSLGCRCLAGRKGWRLTYAQMDALVALGRAVEKAAGPESAQHDQGCTCGLPGCALFRAFYGLFDHFEPRRPS